MNLESVLENVVPLVPEEGKRANELAQLLDLAKSPHTRESSPKGPWGVVHGKGLLFSAPHEVAHLRDGEEKIGESGTAALAFALARYTGGSALATAAPQRGDPSWDIGHPYIARAMSLAEEGPTIDVHMMRPRGVELCVGLGPQPKMAEGLWQLFVEEAVAGGLRVSVNWPFGANTRTVTGQLQAKSRGAIQLELSWECFDPTHLAMRRAWTSLARASRRLIDNPYAPDHGRRLERRDL